LQVVGPPVPVRPARALAAAIAVTVTAAVIDGAFGFVC
jgi:hypothetical protein